MRRRRARQNPLKRNEKIMVGLGLAGGLGLIAFFVLRPKKTETKGEAIDTKTPPPEGKTPPPSGGATQAPLEPTMRQEFSTPYVPPSPSFEPIPYTGPAAP
jgi:hypothetical protein